ncbi:hypothetical protein E1292_00330 [Nonomuraea deserti]|uniref:Uncharacterized protein n=1 Tax=Nonomuraea deserti TaxID=1848322 RepID=A0A4R4W2N6_9ACTN|nr:hypothetical protein [Nonomuraea deserti]TDD12752.1 hypothetical protein E1292_00330 [Nonomuraea deserti]
MAVSPGGPGFAIFTVCWLAFQAFVMTTIGTNVGERSGPAAGFVAFAAAGVLLVSAYLGIVWLAGAVMRKSGHKQQRHAEVMTESRVRSELGSATAAPQPSTPWKRDAHQSRETE